MARKNYLFSNPKKQYTYDFSKKLVKENGKVMDKFSIGYAVSRNGDFYDGLFGLFTEQGVYNYEESKQRFLRLLEEKQFGNVTIIK